MMLEALLKYAEREGLGDPDLHPVGVRWLIPVDLTGGLSGDPIELLEDPDAKKPRPKQMFAPFTSPNELSPGKKSHFLCDSLERATLFLKADETPEKAESRAIQHDYFRSLVAEAAESCPAESPRLKAVAKFLSDKEQMADLHKRLTKQRAKPTENATFQVGGETLVQSPEVQQFWRNRRSAARAKETRTKRICLATGKLAETLDTTEKIKGLPPPGLAMGTNLISFDKAAFSSFNLDQAQNAPISAEAELKMRSALNRLIERGLPLNETIHIHWTREKNDDDPLDHIATADETAVRNLLEAPRTGIRQTSLDQHAYYALSLSGNGARIVVRDWLESTVPEVENNVRQWFDDLSIVVPEGGLVRSAFKLGALLYAMVRDKIDELPPQIPTQILYAALRNSPLPLTALAAAIRRQQIEASEYPNLARFALIKACLLRQTNSSQRKENTAMKEKLNPELRDPAYLCGRLFGVFDYLQFLALGDVGAGIVERFYASASVTPALVMGRLFRTAQFHLDKAGGGAAENVRKDFETICAALGDHFPPTLNLEEQGRFALGFYHQKAEYRRFAAERKQARETAAV